MLIQSDWGSSEPLGRSIVIQRRLARRKSARDDLTAARALAWHLHMPLSALAPESRQTIAESPSRPCLRHLRSCPIISARPSPPAETAPCQKSEECKSHNYPHDNPRDRPSPKAISTPRSRSSTCLRPAAIGCRCCLLTCRSTRSLTRTGTGISRQTGSIVPLHDGKDGRLALATDRIIETPDDVVPPLGECDVQMVSCIGGPGVESLVDVESGTTD